MMFLMNPDIEMNLGIGSSIKEKLFRFEKSYIGRDVTQGYIYNYWGIFGHIKQFKDSLNSIFVIIFLIRF